jgi:hypothetical protein
MQGHAFRLVRRFVVKVGRKLAFVVVGRDLFVFAHRLFSLEWGPDIAGESKAVEALFESMTAALV